MIRQFYRGNEIWTLPGGRIEENETSEQAAIREVLEETGLQIEIKKLLLETYNERINGMYYCYLGSIIGGKLQLGIDPEIINQPQELKEVRWTPIKELDDHKEIQRIIEIIKE